MRHRIVGTLVLALLLKGMDGLAAEEGQFDLSPRSLALLEEAVRKTGDPKSGREIYSDTRDAQCANCHRLQGTGAHVGPDLGHVAEKLSIREIAEALIAPSRKLTEGYETYTVVRTDGKILSGLKISDTADALHLRDQLGKDHFISRSKIARLDKSPVSLMPSRLVSRLSRQDLVNLVSFLKSPGEQKLLEGRLLRAWIAGPFGRVIKKPEPLEKDPDPSKVAASTTGKLFQWKLINTRASGLFQPGSPFAIPKSSFYLLGWIKSDRKRKAALRIDHSSGIRILLNSSTVYTSREAGMDKRLEVDLQDGWNTILCRVNNPTGNSTCGFRLESSAGLRLCADRQD